MARDAIAEWRRALMSRDPAYAMFAKTAAEPSPRHGERAGLRPPSPARGEGRNGDSTAIKPFDISTTRPLAPAARIAPEHGDLSTTIRVLQRHNRLLRARFGIGWADATNFVLGESHRRGTTATLLARTLSLRLREAAS